MSVRYQAVPNVGQNNLLPINFNNDLLLCCNHRPLCIQDAYFTLGFCLEKGNLIDTGDSSHPLRLPYAFGACTQ